jgi:hypothetical protein
VAVCEVQVVDVLVANVDGVVEAKKVPAGQGEHTRSDEPPAAAA